VANGNGTTISVLIEGGFKVTFHVDGSLEDVTLQTKGDYVIFGPDVVHSWEAIGDAIVLSVRFPSSR
jgi:quercetin dioxygenase-like cupin family protein